MIRYDHYTDKFVKVSDRECPWCKAVCASTDKYCHECGWHIADTPQTDCYITEDRDTQILDAWQVEQMQTDCAWMYDSRRDYEYDKALDEMERNFVEFEEFDDGEQETDTTDI